MAKKSIIKNFRSQPHLACGDDLLRPVMQYVFFDDGFIVATNAYILVKQSLHLHDFTDDEIKIMNGKFLHKDAMKEIVKCEIVTVKEDGFHCIKGSIRFVFPFDDVSDMKYPNYRAVIPPESDRTSLPDVGLNLRFLAILQKVIIDTATYSGRFYFNRDDKGVVMTTAPNGLEEELIMIMPIRKG